MTVAEAMSRRSLCVNRQVGCVIVTESNRPISVGYNGPPAGLDRSAPCAGWCSRASSSERGDSYANCTSVHAEANALLFADREQYQRGTIYITNPACWDCAKLIANSGLDIVVWKRGEADIHANVEASAQLLKASGLTVIERGEEECSFKML